MEDVFALVMGIYVCMVPDVFICFLFLFSFVFVAITKLSESLSKALTSLLPYFLP